MSNNTSTKTVLAPLTGKVVPLDQVPDQVFSQKILGDGIDELSVTPNAVLPLRAAIRKSIAKTCTLEMLEC